MIAIQSRPFSRPVTLWMAGIIIQSYFNPKLLSFVLLIIPFLYLSGTLITGKKKNKYPHYNARWIWGVFFACTLLFVSIQTTALHENIRRSNPVNTSKLSEWAQSARQKLIEPIKKLQLTESNKAVLATITTGGSGTMPREVRQQFSITGVVHILSVSGFHVAIVGSFISFLLLFLKTSSAGRWIRFIIMLLAVWTFAIITGLAPPSVRAAFMLSIYLFGKQLNRTTDGYNTLFASAFCMLVYNPLYLFDIGFQLSYLSVASIIYFQPRINKLIKLRNPLLRTPWGWITVSIAAQTGVSFLCLFYFGQFSTVFLLVNLPVILIANLLVPLTLILMLIPESIPFYDILQRMVEFLCESMMWIVEAFSRIPGASFTFKFDFLTMVLCYIALFLLCKLLSGKKKIKDFSVDIFDEKYNFAKISSEHRGGK